MSDEPATIQPGRWYTLPDRTLLFCQLSTDGRGERRVFYDLDGRPRFLEGTAGQQRGRVLSLVDEAHAEGLTVVPSDLTWADLTPAPSPLRHFLVGGTLRAGGRAWYIAQAVHCERAELPESEGEACAEIARRLAERYAPSEPAPDLTELKVQEVDGEGFFFGRVP